MIDDFPVEVEGVGVFRFARRNMRRQLKIEAEARRITGGATEDAALTSMALALAALENLITEAPDSFDIATMDPLDDTSAAAMMKVYGRLRDTELTFRPGVGAKRAGVGTTA